MNRPLQLRRISYATAILEISPSATYRLINSGELVAVRVGERSLRVTEQDLAEYIAKNRGVAQ